MFCQYFQDPLHCLFVFLFRPCKDQNVVQVHYYDPFGYESSENVVHHSLEGSGAVGHSKEYHEGFKEAMIGVEGHLLFISGFNVPIVEPPPDVKFCEVLGSTELGDEFGDEGERIPVLDGHGVQHAIVLD